MSLGGLMDDGPESRFAAGLQVLRQAWEYAQRLQRSPWDFAVEIRTLRRAGLSNSDLRWLVAAGQVRHAREMILPGDQERRFQPIGRFTFTARTCFVLTDAAAAAPQLPSGAGRGGQPVAPEPPIAPAAASGSAVSPREPTPGTTPRWDADCQQLRLGDVVVKEFKLPAADQVRILAAFEEGCWPGWIRNPLPPGPGVQACTRLHHTILGLNRNQRADLVEFLADETGQGIRWRLRSRAEGGH